MIVVLIVFSISMTLALWTFSVGPERTVAWRLRHLQRLPKPIVAVAYAAYCVALMPGLLAYAVLTVVWEVVRGGIVKEMRGLSADIAHAIGRGVKVIKEGRQREKKG